MYPWIEHVSVCIKKRSSWSQMVMMLHFLIENATFWSFLFKRVRALILLFIFLFFIFTIISFLCERFINTFAFRKKKYMSRINISDENLNCHHILFIKDVKESTFVRDRNCHKTKDTNLSYRFARSIFLHAHRSNSFF